MFWPHKLNDLDTEICFAKAVFAEEHLDLACAPGTGLKKN
jgi:hypothetical protein